MRKISKKHWFAFLVLFLFEVMTIMFAPYIAGYTITFIGICLCLGLIRFYLREPLAEYGLCFKKIHIQIISGILLTVMIDYLLLQNSMNITEMIFYIKRYVGKMISDPITVVYFFDPLIYVIHEECVCRGFLLSFLEKIFNNLIVSVSLSAVLFGLAHYPSYHSIEQVVFALIWGFICGYLRLKEAEKFTLFSLSLAHFLHNTLMFNIFLPVI